MYVVTKLIIDFKKTTQIYNYLPNLFVKMQFIMKIYTEIFIMPWKVIFWVGSTNDLV